MTVSVCIATYNGTPFIKDQMDSILAQDLSAYQGSSLEIIVSDDGSTDGSLDIIRSYADPRIKIITHKGKKREKHYTALYAATANFANAIKHTTGDYIFLADQDDIWYPNKISHTLAELIKNGGGVCAAEFDVMTGDGVVYGSMNYKMEPFWRIKRQCMPYGFSLGFSRDMLKYIMPMPKVHQHDSFICLLAQRLNKLYFLHESTAAHRWFGEKNTSSSSMQEPIWQKIWVRAKLYGFVLWRCWTIK